MLLEDFTPSADLGFDNGRVAIDTDTRRIAVRIAEWPDHHSGFNEAVRIPRKVNVDAAHVGQAMLDDGSSLRVATLPMDTLHAPTDLSAIHAAAWYEDSGKGLARGRYSVDDAGIRFDGMLFSDVTDGQIERALSASASGDWRAAVAIKRFSDFEHVQADFVGACIVNIPGYSDTYTKAPGQRMALAASGAGSAMTDDGQTIVVETLVAGSVGVDGLSDDDIRKAWSEKYPYVDGVSSSGSWAREVYFAPAKIIADRGESTFEAAWSIAADGTIEFGPETEVEQVWIPKQETNVTGPVIQAGGGEGEGAGSCDGSCGSCNGSCGRTPEAPVTVTLSASALEALTNGEATDEQKAEALQALVASGAVDAPDPVGDRLARIERLVATLVASAAD